MRSWEPNCSPSVLTCTFARTAPGPSSQVRAAFSKAGLRHLAKPPQNRNVTSPDIWNAIPNYHALASKGASMGTLPTFHATRKQDSSNDERTETGESAGEISGKVLGQGTTH